MTVAELRKLLADFSGKLEILIVDDDLLHYKITDVMANNKHVHDNKVIFICTLIDD